MRRRFRKSRGKPSRLFQWARQQNQIPLHTIVNKQIPHSPADWAVFAAPAVFVLLWASGFIGGKLGLPYAEPMTFLTLRMSAVVALLGVIVLITRPAWPSGTGMGHNAVVGLCVHGLYLGGVFEAMNHGLPAGFTALGVSLQPVLTSTLANRLLGERVTLRQWLGLSNEGA